MPLATMTTAIATDVRHNTDASRFEATVEGRLCVADYRLHDGVMTMFHTEVPRALQGRGIASQLVRAALGHARAQGLKVRPDCSYVASWMRRHPESRDLLAG
jgi:predicted GNAT family acetyltransferase